MKNYQLRKTSSTPIHGVNEISFPEMNVNSTQNRKCRRGLERKEILSTKKWKEI